MSYFENCPRCNSDNVTSNRKRAEAHCDDCGYPDKNLITKNAHEVSCRDLAESNLWVNEVFDFWPGPIAHEYQRLQELLRDEQIVGAVWKLKDIAEILTRFPACVMICDVIANSTDAEFKAKIRSDLLGKVMTMGGWHEFASRIALHMLKNSDADFVCPSLPTLFHEKMANGKYCQSKLNQLLGELTEWRNSDFAHGALRLNFKEFLKDLNKYLPHLHIGLGTFNKKTIWHVCSLLAEDGTPLMGAASIQKQHGKQHHDYDNLKIPIKLRTGNRELSLAPYAQLRRCDECHSQDVFLFDWRNARKNGHDQYRFIDYLAGHHIESPWWKETDLDKESSHLYASAISTATSEDFALDKNLAYLTPEIDRLLADCNINKHYETPNYFRKELAQFVRRHTKGVWWLKAPGHVGKSTFISGIDPKLIAHYSGNCFVDELHIVTFYIRREYQNGVGQLSEQLYLAINEVLRLRTGPGGRPVRQLNIDSDNPAIEFATWLGEFMKIAQLTVRSRKLLICIDGLDELPLPEKHQYSIADFVPSPEDLPEGVYLALTSRPDNELPEWLLPRLQNRLTRATVKDVGLGDKEYVKLMYVYFKKRLSHRIDQALENKPDQTKEKIADLKPLFDESMVKSGGRFLYLGYIVDRLTDGTLKLNDLKKLPPEDQLFEHFFDEIKRIHRGSNLDDYFERVLLHLVAAEQAFEHDRDDLPAVARETNWPGLPIDVLCRRIDPRPDGSITVKLAYTLYSLKPVLSTWRGGSEGQASYRLGLKGLTELIGRRYVERLKNIHVSLIDGLMRQFGPAESKMCPDFDKDMQLRLRYAAIHTRIGGGRSLEAIVPYLNRLADRQLANANAKKDVGQQFDSIRWHSAAIAIQEVLRKQLSEQWSPEYANSLATAYCNRGSIRKSAGDITGAISDHKTAIALGEILREQLGEQWSPNFAINLAMSYVTRGLSRMFPDNATWESSNYDAAIAILEVLREQLGEQWSPKYANALSAAYTSRGFARKSAGDVAGAINDQNAAIAILENLREQLGEQWSPKYANSLATAYSTRGSSRKSAGDITGAISDHNTAIAILETLREQLGEQWSPEYANSLATAYCNRGSIRKSAGDITGAISDHNTAIALGEILREQLGEQLPPKYANSLVGSYTGRGFTRRSAGDIAGAISDHNAAITLGDMLREQLGEQCPTNIIYRLSDAYAGRGLTNESIGDMTSALSDYNAAIATQEFLRERLDEQWSSSHAESFTKGLAVAYKNRARILSITELEKPVHENNQHSADNATAPPNP